MFILSARISRMEKTGNETIRRKLRIKKDIIKELERKVRLCDFRLIN
jgi:hypothetical protein